MVVATGLLGLMMPGCDELVTEVNEFTIAGHPTAEFALDTDSTNCLDSGYYCQSDSGCVPLAVRFLDLSNGPHDEWIWSFGDGTVDTVDSTDTAGMNPIHVYREAGTYTVSLTILDHTVDEEPGVDTEVKKRFIIVGTTIDSFSAVPDSGCPGLEVALAPRGHGGANRFVWHFGDGQVDSSKGDTTHVYDSVGVFSCTLIVRGAECGDLTVVYDSLINITACPQPRIWADKFQGCKPCTVHFEDSTDYRGVDSASIVREWHFADTSANRDTFTYVFEEAGKYVVSLTTTSEGGTATDTLDDTIMVWGPAFGLITANGGVNLVQGCVDDLWLFYVDFEAVFPDTVDIDSFDSLVWYFGDNHRSSPADPMPTKISHPYDTAGEYTVTLLSYGKCAADTAIEHSIIKFICADNRFETSLASFIVGPDADTIADGIQGDTSVVFTFRDTTPISGLTWSWDFGDDISDTLQEVTHQYSDTGTFVVTLTLANCCNDTTLTDTIVIDTMTTEATFRRYKDPPNRR